MIQTTARNILTRPSSAFVLPHEPDTRVRPNALIVGPMKAGTSWLHEYLKSRDDVGLPSGTKETFFFDDRYQTKSKDWYLSHYKSIDRATTSRVVEVAPTYFHGKDVPQRVRETLGRVKIVVTLRDPAARAFSLFQHMRRYGFTQCPTFQSAVETHPRILASSQYNQCIARWESVFGVENVSLLYMDDLRETPTRFAANCCRALELPVPPDNATLPDAVNVATTPRNYHIAKMGRVGGDILRSLRLYPLVDAAKRMGLKKLFFGKPQTVRQKITREEREWFVDQIRTDITSLASRIDRNISSWLS